MKPQVANKPDTEQAKALLRTIRSLLERADDESLRRMAMATPPGNEANLSRTLSYALETRVFDGAAKKLAKMFIVPILIEADGAAEVGMVDTSAIGHALGRQIASCCKVGGRDIVNLYDRIVPIEQLRGLAPSQMYELSGGLLAGDAGARGVRRILRTTATSFEEDWLQIGHRRYFMGAFIGAFIGNQGRSMFTLGEHLEAQTVEQFSRHAECLTSMLLEATTPELGQVRVAALAPHGLCSGIPVASMLLCETYARAIGSLTDGDAQIVLEQPSGGNPGRLDLSFINSDDESEVLSFPFSGYDCPRRL